MGISKARSAISTVYHLLKRPAPQFLEKGPPVKQADAVSRLTVEGVEGYEEEGERQTLLLEGPEAA